MDLAELAILLIRLRVMLLCGAGFAAGVLVGWWLLPLNTILRNLP